MNKHVGQDFDEFLQEEGLLDEISSLAHAKVQLLKDLAAIEERIKVELSIEPQDIPGLLEKSLIPEYDLIQQWIMTRGALINFEVEE